MNDYDGVIVAIGDNQIRDQKLRLLKEAGAPLVNLIHPSATVSRYSKLGTGCVIVAGAVINADCIIGTGVIINTGSNVGHDCIIGNSVHICPGASLAGGVVVGDLSWIGIGSSVRQLVEIGPSSTIGAGATVVKNVLKDTTVIGMPAKAKQKRALHEY